MAITELPLRSQVGSDTRRPWLQQDPEALRSWLADRGEAPLRLKQIRQWILQRRAESFAVMTDLPARLRAELEQHFTVFASVIDQHQIAQDDTHKFLLRLPDQRTIECVLIQEDNRRTACISTQVGCGMGCVFCASGLNGVERNLQTGEILEQLLRLRNATAAGQRLSHIVVMGMGEPLANLEQLLAALEVATQANGLGISARHVTISTVGLPVKIRRLAEAGKAYHLAVSLHAPNDALRSQIVPTNAQTGIHAILDAADAFYSETGRQVTYEYVLLGGLNDSASAARELAQLLYGKQAHVNLIPFNAVTGLPYRQPTAQAVQTFCRVLRQARISVKVRKRKGADIDAACGQLRRKAQASS